MRHPTSLKQFQGRSPYVVVLSTFPNRKEAARIASGLLEERLAACCNLLPGLTSFFRWKGKRERAKECLLLIKTTSSLLRRVQRFIRTHHSYDLPEIIGIPVRAGDGAYLKWITDETR